MKYVGAFFYSKNLLPSDFIDNQAVKNPMYGNGVPAKQK